MFCLQYLWRNKWGLCQFQHRRPMRVFFKLHKGFKQCMPWNRYRLFLNFFYLQTYIFLFLKWGHLTSTINSSGVSKSHIFSSFTARPCSFYSPLEVCFYLGRGYNPPDDRNCYDSNTTPGAFRCGGNLIRAFISSQSSAHKLWHLLVFVSCFNFYSHLIQIKYYSVSQNEYWWIYVIASF